MPKRGRLIVIAALGLLLGVPSPGAVAAWDCTANFEFVRRPTEARGVTFRGTLEATCPTSCLRADARQRSSGADPAPSLGHVRCRDRRMLGTRDDAPIL